MHKDDLTDKDEQA